MIETLIAVVAGIVGVCTAVVGGVLLQVAVGEWRLQRRVGELAPGSSKGEGGALRPVIAAGALFALGLGLIAIVVVAQLS